MKMIIKNTMRIKRPLVFLCGPYYEEKAFDRRKILKDFLTSRESKHNVIPIIVDKFLDKKNINDDSINIDLLEEICAAVAFKTYIFLDTFSSVAELGMFSSRTCQNQIDIFIPNKSDIICNNIGFFVREIIENDNNDKIQCFYYRPKIVRVPLASEYVTEFYEFTRNELPQNIRNSIINDKTLDAKEYNLEFIESVESMEENGFITYQKNNSKINFKISVRMLFYIIASISLNKIKKEIVDEVMVNETVNELKEILKNSYCYLTDFDEIQINTKILFDIEIIIKHILVFIKLYDDYGDSEGRHIITKEDSFIKEMKSYEYFGMSQENEDLINEYLDVPNNFIETIKIKRGKRMRKITRYKNDEKGKRLREFHELVFTKFQEMYSFSDNSYAYRKGFSIIDCINPHKQSISFLKIDITNFFNSIKYMELYNHSKSIVVDFFILDKKYGNLIKACLYNNKLPLGLITSPILSDIYLHKFDKNVTDILGKYNKKVIFTRYADDMIFSCEEEMDNNDIEYITNLLSEELAKINLEINHEKTICKRLVEFGDHIKLLGLNVVKTNTKNELTVGKKFINETCKLYLDYLDNKNNAEVSEESKFYTEKRIAGCVAYIKQIEGTVGYEKLRKRINKATNERVDIPNYKIEF